MRWQRTVVLAGTLTVTLAATAAAQQDTTDAERRARRARQGAGLRFGMWNVTGLTEVSGATYRRWPMFEGYFQKGLDRHLVLENSVGLWRRVQSSGSGTGAEQIRSYVIPQLTQLKLYPATTVEDNVEPYVAGGVGLTVGVDNRETVSGGLLGGGGSGTALIVGIGFKGSAGVELRLGRVFGLAGYVGYQYVYFLEPVGSEQSYRGFIAGGGITYRYQY
jgi:hypothetical protein